MLHLAHDGITDDPIEPVDVAAIAEVVVADLQAAHPDHHITLGVTGEGHVVIGSPARLHQAILNLGANACHHSNPADPVSVDVASRPGTVPETVCVRVVSHGPGVDPVDCDRVLLPFYRADRARRRHGRTGAGLGLALTKRIADHHDGTIALKTTPGGGATFVLSLPAARPIRPV